MNQQQRICRPNHIVEFSFQSQIDRADPFGEAKLDLLVTCPDGSNQEIPGFWAGNAVWRTRYSSPQPGLYTWRTRCSDVNDAGLHDQYGEFEVVSNVKELNPLLRHGPIQVTSNRRHLEHADGTPFLWLGDTWWMGFCRRLGWPDDVRDLSSDRVSKGFNVIHLVAGLYPDMDPFDERGSGDGGFPWTEDFSRINPDYFDAADLRIAHLVSVGIVPCVVGFWGFFLDIAGEQKLQDHWRYLIARWGAYPVVWCVAGEALMPFYTTEAMKDMKQCLFRGEPWLPPKRRRIWSNMARYIKKTDGHGRPVTIHPTRFGTDQVDDPTSIDLNWLQTGHNGYPATERAVDMLEKALTEEPRMPVLDSEGNYEMINGTNRDDIQRFQFWSTMMVGAAGYSYGANGIWQVDRSDQPYGASPHGTSWGGQPWDQAKSLPGSTQVGIGRRILERFEWWLFEPHPEWVDPAQGPGDRHLPYAAGIPGKIRLLYVPCEVVQPVHVCALEAGHSYHAVIIDPSTGDTYKLGKVTGDSDGRWLIPTQPFFHDWLTVLHDAEM